MMSGAKMKRVDVFSEVGACSSDSGHTWSAACRPYRPDPLLAGPDRILILSDNQGEPVRFAAGQNRTGR